MNAHATTKETTMYEPREMIGSPKYGIVVDVDGVQVMLYTRKTASRATRLTAAQVEHAAEMFHALRKLVETAIDGKPNPAAVDDARTLLLDILEKSK